MPVLYLLGVAFVVSMAITAVRRGQAGSWLWIILLFGPIGAAVYFFSQVVDLPLPGGGAIGSRPVTAADLRHAEAEVKRLDNVHTWSDYAAALLARKRYAEAQEAAKRALAHDPESIDAWYTQGTAALARNLPGDAAVALEKVVARDRRYRAGEALHALAVAQHASGRLEEARATLEELAGISSRPEMLFDLATLQAQGGENEAAIATLERIVEEAEMVPGYARKAVKPWVRKARAEIGRLKRGGEERRAHPG